ncbi:helix-turn-helix domain-containing protein [Priestia sp. SB1]|uniref:MarR family transcriptional regulator n=1 Tax=Priestia sp. SB1 TaxID=3132359 RepID=UPI003176BB92
MNTNEDYFEIVVSNLDVEDIGIMAFLHKNNAIDSIYAIKTSVIREQIGMSKSSLNQVLNRLKLANLIQSIHNSNKYSIFLTEFGKAALHIKTNGGMKL